MPSQKHLESSFGLVYYEQMFLTIQKLISSWRLRLKEVGTTCTSLGRTFLARSRLSDVDQQLLRGSRPRAWLAEGTPWTKGLIVLLTRIQFTMRIPLRGAAAMLRSSFGRRTELFLSRFLSGSVFRYRTRFDGPSPSAWSSIWTVAGLFFAQLLIPTSKTFCGTALHEFGNRACSCGEMRTVADRMLAANESKSSRASVEKRILGQTMLDQILYLWPSWASRYPAIPMNGRLFSGSRASHRSTKGHEKVTRRKHVITVKPNERKAGYVFAHSRSDRT